MTSVAQKEAGDLFDVTDQPDRKKERPPVEVVQKVRLRVLISVVTQGRADVYLNSQLRLFLPFSISQQLANCHWSPNSRSPFYAFPLNSDTKRLNEKDSPNQWVSEDGNMSAFWQGAVSGQSNSLPRPTFEIERDGPPKPRQISEEERDSWQSPYYR